MKKDGEIYLLDYLDNAPPPPSHETLTQERENSSDVDLWGEFQPYYIVEEARTAQTTLYERTLFRTKDPTSFPHTRKECVKWASSSFPPIRTCIGWKFQYRYIYITAVLRVTTSTPVNIKNSVEECLKQSAIIAAITAILSGGTAAIATAKAALKACLLTKLGSNLLTVSINLHHRRGDWE